MRNETVVFTEPGGVTLREGDAPNPDAGELLVGTERSLVSTGTELTVLSGEFPEGSRWADYGTYPFTAGYCNVGTVVDAGRDADGSWVGRRVATRAPHARYATVDPDAGLCVPVPDAVRSEAAAFFAVAGIVMNGVRRSRLEWGEDVAVYGLGLLGQLAVRVCRLAGARSVVGFDLAASRLDYLNEDATVTGYDPGATDPAAAVGDAAREGEADVVFEVTGAPDAVADQFEVLRPAGRFVVLSSPRGTTELDLHDHCNGPSYEIIGAHESSHAPRGRADDAWSYRRTGWTHPRHYELFFDYVRDGRLDAESLVSHRVDAGDAPATYRRLLDDRTDALGVVLEW